MLASSNSYALLTQTTTAAIWHLTKINGSELRNDEPMASAGLLKSTSSSLNMHSFDSGQILSDRLIRSSHFHSSSKAMCSKKIQ